MLYQKSTIIFSEIVEKNNVEEIFKETNKLKINRSKGVFITQLHDFRTRETHEKRTEICEIANYYFKARVNSENRDFVEQFFKNSEFPEILIQTFLRGIDITTVKLEIDMYIDLVRSAGGFIEKK